ncbi:NAD(P)H-dependent glycerol-3-phosphate dehydrogenase [Dasania marina]|uniref:NAD(P)H-dependent glycerol-3-phosphate dehydrogenase n=1 Tax=Dasania marina TaxID=471499 RepID=UPI00035DCE67|nr:NAD(P)H-dependent glycerol-3-phosphate dehydrogenase [Dasania marina]
MNVVIVGLGNLGSAVATVLANNGHSVTAWEFNQAVVDEVNLHHKNSVYQPAVAMPSSIVVTSDMQQLNIAQADAIIITLPSRFIEQALTQLAPPESVPLVNMAKGINPDNGETVCQSLQRLFPKHVVAQLSGPSIANEFVSGVVTGFVAASDARPLQLCLASLFNNQHLSVQFCADRLGVELGGVFKNCYALGLGIVNQHARAGLNFTGAYFTQALQEMRTLAVAMGAKSDTFDGIACLGDLIATALSESSHNRKMGELLAQGLSLSQVEQQMGVLAEGHKTLLAMLPLAQRHDVPMPLAQLIDELISDKLSLDDFFSGFNNLLKAPE